MKNFTAQLVIVLTFFCCIDPVHSQEDPQTIAVPLTSPARPVFLEIGIPSARIEVLGEDRDDAEFSVIVSGGERKIITPSGPKTLNGGGYQLEVEEEDNRIEVHSNSLRNKVNIIARIPRQANLDLSTFNNGEIIVSNIVGKLELKNVNGPISAGSISGSVIAESVNDVINIGFTEVSEDGVTSMSTMNGDIYLALPADAGVELHLDSSRGEIVSDFEVEVQPNKSEITRDVDDDGFKVRVENTIVATINGGGPVIKLKTFKGNIQINKSAR